MESGAKSIYRTLDLLSALGGFPDGAGVNELAAHLGFPPSTAHRLLRVMVSRGFAAQDPVSKRYTLGPSVTRLAHQASNGLSLKDLARPHIEALAAATQETTFFSLRDGDRLVYVDCINTGHALQILGTPGDRVPLHATSQGKAILAYMDAEERDRLLSRLDFQRFTDATITDLEVLKEQMSAVRERGFATQIEEREPGVLAAAAPVLDAHGRSLAAVCVGAPVFRVSAKELHERIVPAVVATARAISDRAASFTHPSEVAASLLEERVI